MTKTMILKQSGSQHRLHRHLMQAGMLLVAATAACGQTVAEPASTTARPFTVHEVVKFSMPWAIAFLPGTNLALVTEKGGALWLVDVVSGAKQPVAGVPPVKAGGQGGLLDVVVAPTFATDRRVYLTYAEPSANGGSGLALARATLVQGAAARLDKLEMLWRDPAGGRGGQFGAIVVFAPDKRSLFLSSGERQRFTPAQDANQPIGKILHLTLDGKPAPGNPWAGRVGVATVTVTDPPKNTEVAKAAVGRSISWPGPNRTPAETWSTGHRNPYGLAFDSAGRLWETEMGPKGGDEVNLIKRGQNYGWPLVSNGDNYDDTPIARHTTRPDLAAPKLFWNPSVSPTSLLIYRGKLFPQWKGSGLIGALSAKALIRISFNGETARKAEHWDMGARIRFVGEGPDGALYLLEDEGPLVRLDPVRR